MVAHWQNEKDAIAEIRELKERLEQARTDAERAEREGDLERAAQLRYGTIRELEREIEAKTERLDELQRDAQMLKEEVDEEDVAEIVAKWTGIPVRRLMEGEMAKLVRMEEVLHERVIGQDDAVTAVANAIRRSRAGLSDPNRPIGSFLFLGPTGVGKTELARTLADFLFDDERAMVRIDMSEYMEKHSVSRLVGAPPGYVGYEEGGQLTEAVRRRPVRGRAARRDREGPPRRVQRAAPAAGRRPPHRRPGPHGRLHEHRADHDEQPRRGWPTKHTVLAAVRNHFKPEFLNRIDEIVVFHRLDEAHIARIVDIQVEQLRERLAERGLGLELTDAARAHIARGRLRPRLRRPAAQAGAPAGGRRPDRARAAEGRVPRRRRVVVDAAPDRPAAGVRHAAATPEPVS